MGTKLTILFAICLFVVITFLYWKITKPYVLKMYGKKMSQHWTSRTFYWTSVLFMSGGITVLVIVLLKKVGGF